MSTEHEIHYETHTKTVQDFFHLYQNEQLNLEPGFQRDSVWTLGDRRRLIDSIVRGYPLPSIFLYQRNEGGQVVYDVIDGKQRIETFLMFAGQMWGKKFDAKVALPNQDVPISIDWNDLKKKEMQPLITAYKLQCIEVRGSLSDIIDLFVRINSTGKALTAQEKLHARFFNSPFLITAEKLARRFREYFLENHVFSQAQLSRMKDVELICELMLSAHNECVINKKAAVDKAMESGSFSPKAIKKSADCTICALKSILRVLPSLKTTRFRQVVDFYSLAVLIQQYQRDGQILTDTRRNRLARDLLHALGTGVDLVRMKIKKGQGAKANEELFRAYMLTVLAGTDTQDQRQRRAEILDGLLGTLFEKKDKDRIFSMEQRRVLWNTTATRKCCECGHMLTWEDFTIDHIKPWSKGGKTALDNAALMCLNCNSAKGNR